MLSIKCIVVMVQYQCEQLDKTFLWWFLTALWSQASRHASIPWLCGMLVYNDVTFSETRMVPEGRGFMDLITEWIQWEKVISSLDSYFCWSTRVVLGHTVCSIGPKYIFHTVVGRFLNEFGYHTIFKNIFLFLFLFKHLFKCVTLLCIYPAISTFAVQIYHTNKFLLYS